MKLIKYTDILVIDGQELNKEYLQSLSYEQREELVEPIFSKFREIGFMYPDFDEVKLRKEWRRLLDYQPDLTATELFNNSSLATFICKYFCRKSFFNTTDPKGFTMEQVFNDDVKLKNLIRNRMGMGWLLPSISKKTGEELAGVNQAFDMHFRELIKGMRSMRLVGNASIFKPNIARHLYEKYCPEPNSVIYDYSAGFCSRALGSLSSKNNYFYIATDPLTINDGVQEMVNFFGLSDRCKLIPIGSEHYNGDENSVDMIFSSPPYYDMEVYSKEDTQAYNKGETYFYEEYWKKTLQNCKKMLKPGKWFGLNILAKYNKMIDMAKEEFGEVKEEVYLRTVRGHMTKAQKTLPVEKNESCYMFINEK